MRSDDSSVFAALQEVVGSTVDNSIYNRDIIDIYVLRKARQKGIRLPTGGPPEEYKYLGAWVEPSTAGTSLNVVYIDVSSMYPSLIMSLNASPETVVGTRHDLQQSQYDESDCVWGYIDTRDVYHLDRGEPWSHLTDSQYKMVYDPHKNSTKWTCDDADGPRYEKLYFLDHDVQKGFLTECVEELIALKNRYRGTSLYGSTKRVTNCFTPDTEVLTPNGSVNIKDVDVGDTVYTFDTATRHVSPTTVDEHFEYPQYNGTVYRFHNEDLDLEVTPHHNMVYQGADGTIQTTEAKSLAQMLTSQDVLIPYLHGLLEAGGTRLTQDDVERYRTSFGVYCLNVGGDNTVIAGRNGKFSPVKQSVYGTIGFANEGSSFRLFDWRIAEAVTLSGRKMIQHSRDYVLEYVRDRGYEDAYAAVGDTDGVGIALPSAATRHEAMAIIEEAVEQLNTDGYDAFFENVFNVSPEQHHGEIEIESYAPKLFVPSQNPPNDERGVKKRRIEWETWNDDDGECDEISITGLEAKRSDVAPITTEAQELFAEMLRHDDGRAREELFPQLRSMAQSVQMGEIALSRVAKRSGIGQDLSEYGTSSRRASTFYRGCKYANNNIDGVTIQRGDKPALVYVTDVRGDYPSVYNTETAEDGDVVDAVTVPNPEKLPDDFVVDWDRHWKKALKEPMEPLLETRFGADAWGQILDGTEQVGLEGFAD